MGRASDRQELDGEIMRQGAGLRKVRDGEVRQLQRGTGGSAVELGPQLGETRTPEGQLSPWGEGDSDGSS